MGTGGRKRNGEWNGMNEKKISKTQVIRHGIQLVAFLLFPGLFITAFAAVRDIYKAVLDHSFGLSAYANQLLLLLAIFPITIVFGRFFCGYLCSFGALGDLLWAVSGRIMKKPVSVSAGIDRILKCLKYVVLLFAIVAVWTLAAPVDGTYNPWNIFGIYSSWKGWVNWAGLFSVGGTLLLLIMVGNFFVERFFCRYLCPLGAIFAILSHFRLYRIKKPGEQCGSCQLCTKKCSMGIPLNTMDLVRSGECIDCYRCVDVCPRENVSTAPSSSPAVVGTAAAVALTGLYYAGTMAAPKLGTHQEYDTVSSESVVNQNAYADGVYTGEGNGFRGKITVEVKVENGMIAEITIVSADDDRDFFERASEGVIAEIISRQSVDVDAVSGATFSSNGIIEAVADALNVSFANPGSENQQKGHGHGKRWKR